MVTHCHADYKVWCTNRGGAQIVHSTAAVAYPINLIFPDVTGASYLYLHVRKALQFITLCFNIRGGVCVNDNACLKTAHFHVDKSTSKC